MAVDVKIEERYLALSHGKTRILEAASGYPTLLVHGAGFWSGADTWLPVMPDLAEKLRVIAMDCLNYGKGDVFNQEFSFAYMVDHIREVIDALGVEKVNLVGHSMGGWLGTLFGYESPHRLNKLVLVAAGGTQARPLANMVDWQPPSEEEIRQRAGSSLPPDQRERVQQIYLDKLRKPDHVEAFAKVMKHMTNPDTRARYNTMRRLAHIPVPTLVIWGSDDKTNDISMGHELAEGIPGARLVIYEGVGHAVPQEAPERFTTDVLAFLEEGSN
jgi:pimeloyl-ACP methyl ester carboxylesterase